MVSKKKGPGAGDKTFLKLPTRRRRMAGFGGNKKAPIRLLWNVRIASHCSHIATLFKSLSVVNPIQVLIV